MVPRMPTLFALQHDPNLTPAEIFEAHVTFGNHFPDVPRPPLQPGNRKIRVGYVSSDFCGHAVACFLLPILETHNRLKFEIFLYSKTRQPDLITEWFKLQGKWREIGEDDAAFQAIRADGIDILVDCAGHTTGKSLSLFARRPAPIAVTYLGYPDTTGLRQIDYRITDEISDPEGSLAVERLIRLLNGCHTYRSIIETEEPQIREGPIVFGYLGRLAKVTPAVRALWQRILQAVPGSTLVLNEKRDMTPKGYFATYNKIDISLDPFPYNGTTTICDSLWMGVPAVTLRGQRSAARVGASLLTRIGLQDYIAADEAGYFRIAVGLAADRACLAHLRTTLRDRFLACPLGDSIPVTRDLERFYADAVAALRNDAPGR
jgi:protein O-GlcNAc transferase